MAKGERNPPNWGYIHNIHLNLITLSHTLNFLIAPSESVLLRVPAAMTCLWTLLTGYSWNKPVGSDIHRFTWILASSGLYLSFTCCPSPPTLSALPSKPGKPDVPAPPSIGSMMNYIHYHKLISPCKIMQCTFSKSYRAKLSDFQTVFIFSVCSVDASQHTDIQTDQGGWILELLYATKKFLVIHFVKEHFQLRSLLTERTQ